MLQWVINRLLERIQEIIKFLELNDNERTTFQNLWDTVETVLTGKSIAENAHFEG